MRIKYKKPYWLKFSWDINEHHDNQHVTLHDIYEDEGLIYFFLNPTFAITINFKIKLKYKKDDISMLYGFPGKNLGLTYNKTSNTIAFEFRNDNDKFYYLPLLNTTIEEIENGITITVLRNNDEIVIYKNYEKNNSITFDGNLLRDNNERALYIGCSSPESSNENYRYHGEYDIFLFSIIKSNNIEKIKDCLIPNEIHKLPLKSLYNDIICYYDFKTSNNLELIYDESKNTNFLQKVPIKFIK